MYAIVCSEVTKRIWPGAYAKLKAKYDSKWPGRVHTVTYDNGASVSQSLPAIAELKPSYTCFLAPHSECSREYVQSINELTRGLDPSTPYTDTVWGILTGLMEEDILFALQQQPLEVQRVLGNCPVDLDRFESGVWYSECRQGVSTSKRAGQGRMVEEPCPPDTTALIAGQLSEQRDVGREEGIDMVITSEHATENDWNIAYTFRGGQFCCTGGQLYGCCVDGVKIDLKRTRSPKILSAAGNCLMGHIADRDSMALGWMHSGSVVQMTGYVVPTWFGYGGWGVHKYFINNPGAMSFAEAFFANQQSLVNELCSSYQPEANADGSVSVEDHNTIYRKCFNTGETAHASLSRDCSGLLYDQNNVAFYGDPAWEARLVPNPASQHYESRLTQTSRLDKNGWVRWEYSVVTLKAGQWACPVPDDKSTAPGRPPVMVFPCSVRAAKLLEGNAVVTCRFLLLPLSGAFQPGEVYRISFATKT